MIWGQSCEKGSVDDLNLESKTTEDNWWMMIISIKMLILQ